MNTGREDQSSLDANTDENKKEIRKMNVEVNTAADKNKAENSGKIPTVKKLEKQKRNRLRKRHKNVYNDLRKQMEFYFSDANLSRDRYLSKLITADPFVPISIFMTFNKIKAYAKSIKDVITALNDSEILQVSNDKTKVHRITPITLRSDLETDECTIYIETIPEITTHDYIRSLFEEYGPIVYISIPRYKNSRKIKGFAFIEYEHKSSVLKALLAFKKTGGILNKGSLDLESLCSISSYIKEQKEEEKEQQQQSDQPQFKSKSVQQKNVTVSENLMLTQNKTNSKRKMRETEKDEELPVKKNKFEENIESSETKVSKSNDAIKKIKEVKENKTEIIKQETSPNKNKTRKKKKKVISNIITEKEFIQIQRIEYNNSYKKNLRITTKSEWKKLRNKYLNYQRNQMKEIKNQLRAEAFKNQPNNYNSKMNSKDPRNVNYVRTSTTTTTTTTTAEKQNQSMDVYEENEIDINKNKEEFFNINVSEYNKPSFEYQPGLIVKFKFNKFIVDIRKFKNDIRKFPYVKYVDVKEGDKEAFVRIECETNGPELIKESYKQQQQYDCKCEILQGDMEANYWDKIKLDREQKLSKGIKIKAKRGREKMKKKIKNHTIQQTLLQQQQQQQHIRFEDD